MSFETLVAPHINVNDLEMIVAHWQVKPWQLIKKDDAVCEVETTKSITIVYAPCDGYIYPVVLERSSVKVGAPLAHIFLTNDPKQLQQLEVKVDAKDAVIISKKAQALMSEHGLTVCDFPKFATIGWEMVVAKIRELKPKEVALDEAKLNQIVNRLSIHADSVAIYGEKNQALLALDAFETSGQFKAVAYINSFITEDDFYGIPVLSAQTLKDLKKKGLKNIYICGQDFKTKEEQIQECEALGLNLVSAVHPSSAVSTRARLGKGIFIGAKAAIGPDVTIGDFTQVLCAATIAHHTTIGRFVNIADGAHLGGNVTVGDYSVIGIGVNINRRITLGRNVTVVSGATVIEHVSDDHILRMTKNIN